MSSTEWVGILLALVAVFSTVCGTLAWRMFTRLEAKVDDIHRLCLTFPEKYVTQEMFRLEKELVWKALHPYSYAAGEKVAK